MEVNRHTYSSYLQPSLMEKSLAALLIPSPTEVSFLRFGRFPPTVVTQWRGTTTIQFTQDPAYFFAREDLTKEMGFAPITADVARRVDGTFKPTISKIKAFSSTLVDKVHSDDNDDEKEAGDEFIKLEKEFKSTVEVTKTSGAENPGSTNLASNINLLMEEKIQELELQLKISIEDLKQLESEKASVKSEVDIANEKLETLNKHCEELELNQKMMHEKIWAAEEKNNSHLQTLQEALAAKDMKNQELLDIKGAYTYLSAELEMSRKKMEEFEKEIFTSSLKVHLLEELNKETSSQAELESARALEFEKMLEIAQVKEKDMDGWLGKLQNELEVLYDKLAENHITEQTLQTTSLQLSTVQEKFEISKTQVVELEQKIIAQVAIINDLTEKLIVCMFSEEKTKAEVEELEIFISKSEDDLKGELLYLEEVEHKLDEQIKEHKIVKTRIQDQEIQILSLEKDLEDSSFREKELLEKLRYAEEQLEKHGKAVDELNARNLELKSLHELFVRNSKLRLQKAEEKLKQKVSDDREFQKRMKFLEEQMAYFQDQAMQANEKTALLKAELEVNAIKLVSLEKFIKKLLSGTNTMLRKELKTHHLKVNELNALLSTIHTEKEETSKLLACQVERIAKLTDECSTVSELHSATESHFKGFDVELHEVIEKPNIRDSENKILNDKLLNLEAQLKTYEEQASELAEVATNQEGKLAEALSKLWNLKGLFEQLLHRSNHFRMENEVLARQNLSLTNELATYVTKINEMQIALSSAPAGKGVTSKQLHSSKGKMTNLMNKLISDKERCRSQIKIMRSEAARWEEDISAKLKEHMSIFQETNNLNQQQKQIQNECDLAQRIIIEQVKIETVKAKSKDRGEFKSGDLASNNSKYLMKIGENLHQASQATFNQTELAVAEPLEAMALKFILGVAFLSLIMGMILGKWY